uniref:Uncharacterized protein n=1 Tax=Solibacter usitatus (strain Ellin6076) TaxID=234267 RepID=Q01UD1_SOLUE
MDFLQPVYERVAARLVGPMHVRFIVQPVIAAILGIRIGIRDAREGTPPFVWSLCRQPEGRKAALKQALGHLAIPLIVAIVLDGIVQFVLFQRVRVLGAVIVGTLLMGLPYSIARGLANRIASARQIQPKVNESQNRHWNRHLHHRG